MAASDELPQMQRHIGNLIAQQPTQTQEGRRIADQLLGGTNRAIPVVFTVRQIAVGGLGGQFVVALRRYGNGPALQYL